MDELIYDIEQVEKALHLSNSMVKLNAMPEFQAVFVDNFVEAYRATANYNIGKARPDSVEMYTRGLIGRANFQSFCEELIEVNQGLKEQLLELNEELVAMNKEGVE